MRPLVGLTAAALVLPSVMAAPVTAASADESVAATRIDDEVTLLVRWVEEAGTARRTARLSDAGVGADTAPREVSQRVDALDVAADDADALATTLEGFAEVDLVELDRSIEVTLGEEPTGGSGTVPPAELFDQQWGLENRGRELGPVRGPDGDSRMVETTAGIDVRAPEAWATSFGDPDVVVGVIDTPIDLLHPDLSSSIVDEIDLIETPSGRSHGTQVASIIAAGSRDGGTMLGLAPDVGILSIAAFTEAEPAPDHGTGGRGQSSTERLVAAFGVAEERQVDVVNASWVGEFSPGDSDLLEASIAELGIPVVAASGNERRDLSGPGRPQVPVGYDLPNLISVTAIDPLGEVPNFANVGRGVVDVAAPGRAVLAARPGVDDYVLANGTSFAAPFVSAAIALGRSVAPDATAGELIDAVRWTSGARPTLASVTTAGGMLDAAAYVDGVPRPVCGGAPPSAGFPDVGAGAVHARSIDCIAAKAITSGRADGTFAPASTVSRAEMAAFIARMVESARPDLPEPPPAGFVDVDEDHIHARSIDVLADLGIVRGDTQGAFRPAEPVSRGQVAAFLVRAYDELVGDPQPPTRVWFDDVAETTHAAAIGRARDLGLVRGVATVTYEPGASTRRDQMASLLARTLDALAREEVAAP